MAAAATPRSLPLPADGPDPLRARFATRTHHFLLDSSHRRPQDPSYDYRVYFGVADDTGQAQRGAVFKNVVCVNVVDAEIPRTADNIIDGRNVLHVRVGGAPFEATVQHGLYLDVSAVSAVLVDALNAMGADASWDVEVDARSRLRIYASRPFTVVAEGALAHQLGVVSAASVLSVANDGNGVAAAHDFPHMVESSRFTNLMPRPYVDIVVPELPRAGTKLTNSPSSDAERVLARVPLGATPGGAQHYEPGEALLLRGHFSPISLPYLTIRLYGSDGAPYDARDTPHRIALEIVELADPIVPEATPPSPPPSLTPLAPRAPPASLAERPFDRPVGWLDENKWNVLLATAGAVTTFYLASRLKEMVWRPAEPPLGPPPPAPPRPRPPSLAPQPAEFRSLRSLRY